LQPPSPSPEGGDIDDAIKALYAALITSNPAQAEALAKFAPGLDALPDPAPVASSGRAEAEAALKAVRVSEQQKLKAAKQVQWAEAKLAKHQASLELHALEFEKAVLRFKAVQIELVDVPKVAEGINNLENPNLEHEMDVDQYVDLGEDERKALAEATAKRTVEQLQSKAKRAKASPQGAPPAHVGQPTTAVPAASASGAVKPPTKPPTTGTDGGSPAPGVEQAATAEPEQDATATIVAEDRVQELLSQAATKAKSVAELEAKKPLA